MDNRKIQRTNSDIYRIVASYIAEHGIGADVVEVKTTADLSEAKVFVTDELKTLEAAAGFLRSEIARRLNLRNTPKIIFIKDKGRENAARVEELLEQIKKKGSVQDVGIASSHAPRNDKGGKK